MTSMSIGWSPACGPQDRAVGFEEIRAAQFARREIHRDADARMPVPPARSRPAARVRNTQRPTATISPVSSSTGMKSAGETSVSVGAPPAQQRFGAEQALRRAVEFRLVVQHEFLVVDRAAEIAFQFQPARRATAHVFVERQHAQRGAACLRRAPRARGVPAIRRRRRAAARARCRPTARGRPFRRPRRTAVVRGRAGTCRGGPTLATALSASRRIGDQERIGFGMRDERVARHARERVADLPQQRIAVRRARANR